MRQFGYPAESRIKKTREFRRVFDGQVRCGDHLVLVFVQPSESGSRRLGLSVSKKHGNAVKRVRKKRLLREAFRLEQAELPDGWDYVVVPRASSLGTLTEYRRSLVKQAQRAVRRYGERSNRPSTEP